MATRRRIASVDQAIRPELLTAILDAPGATPLDIMTNTMRLLYSAAQNALRDAQGAEGPEREYLMDVARKHSVDACQLAREIAPYMHRKQPIALETKDMTDEDKRKMADTVRELEQLLLAKERSKRSAKSMISKAEAPSAPQGKTLN